MGPIPEELHELVEQNAGLVWSVAMKWRRSGLDLDDLAQAGMVGLCKAAVGYDPERGMFSTYATWWVRATVRRAAEKLLKHQGLVSLDGLDDEAPDEADGLDDLLIADEIRARVWSAVDRLPAKDAEVVRLRYWDGLNQQQAGARLGVTRTRAYQREQRALASLRGALA